VLHPCGDGDEAMCLAPESVFFADCTTLECCAVIGVP